MKISKRDLEALLKKEFQFKDEVIYMDQVPICLSIYNGSLRIVCNQWLDLLKLFLRGKKYIYFHTDCIEIKHPFIHFESVNVIEDEIEITFK